MIRRFFAAILIVIFVSFSFAFSLIWGFYNILSDKDFYTGELLDLFYVQTVDRVSEELTIQEFSKIDEDEIRKIVELAIPKDDIAFIVEDVIQQFDSNNISSDGILTISVPLKHISDNSTDLAEGISSFYRENLPDCTQAQLADSIAVSNFECVPGFLAEEDFTQEVNKVVRNKVFAEFPNEYMFDLQMGPNIKGDLGEYFSNTFFILFIFGLGLCLVFLILIALIIFKPLGTVLKYEGSAFFSYAMVLLIFLYQFSFGEKVLSMFQQVDQNLNDLYKDVYLHINDKLLDTLMSFGLFVMILGVSLIVFGFIINKRQIKDSTIQKESDSH